MDMKKILQNLDSAEQGDYKLANTNDSAMKTILESLQGVQEGYPMPTPPPPVPAPEDKGTPVTMNISMNASGKEHVADLVDMMKNAGLGDAKPMAPDMMPVRMDMERLRDIVDEPEMDSPCGAGADNRPDEAYMDTEDVSQAAAILNKNDEGALSQEGDSQIEEARKVGHIPGVPLKWSYPSEQFGGFVVNVSPKDVQTYKNVYGEPNFEEHKYYGDPSVTTLAFNFVRPYDGKKFAEEHDAMQQKLGEMADEGYANEPDEKHGDHNQMLNDLSGGLNKKKKMFKKAQDGDNAMAVESIKSQLYRALAEKKKSMVKDPKTGKMVPSYAIDGKGKDDLKKG